MLDTYALIDADVCVHSVCNQAERGNPEGEPLPYVLHSLKLQIRKWIEDAGANADDPSTFQVYLSGPSGTNFRYDVDPNYKGTRKSKPRYFKEAREYLVANWGAVEVMGEADDALAGRLHLAYLKAEDEATYWSEPVEDWCTTVCVSVDKDLLMVPGLHYNPRKDEQTYTDEYHGWYRFFGQMLTGDTVDNIKGLAKVGPVKAASILGSADQVYMGTLFEVDEYAIQLYTAVVKAYASHRVSGKFVAEYTDIFQAADLLWMVRDGRRGHQALLDLVPGHLTKAMFDKARADAPATPSPKRKPKRVPNKDKLSESERAPVPAVDPNPTD